MNTATHLNTWAEGKFECRLWQLSPAHHGHKHIVTLAWITEYAREVDPQTGLERPPLTNLQSVCAFPSDAAGRIDDDTLALPGAKIARTLDHTVALAQLGYTVAPYELADPCEQWDTDDAAADTGVLADRAHEQRVAWEVDAL